MYIYLLSSLVRFSSLLIESSLFLPPSIHPSSSSPTRPPLSRPMLAQPRPTWGSAEKSILFFKNIIFLSRVVPSGCWQ